MLLRAKVTIWCVDSMPCGPAMIEGTKVLESRYVPHFLKPD